MGEALGRPASTISRELKRNSKRTPHWAGGYEPVRAHSLAQRRRRWGGRYKLARQPVLRGLVRDGLAMGWSPEQIAGRLAQRHGSTVISHEAIYRFIYHRSAQKDYWHRLLPHAKHRRGWLGARGGSSVEHIKDRVPIAARPAHVAARTQPGHWETDLIVFSNKKDNVLVTQERVSRFVVLAGQSDKTARRTANNLVRWFATLPAHLRHSLTQDNGTEFAHHYRLNSELAMKTFFCDPHRPWQKGGVENMNGRLRRWLPLKTDPKTLTPPRLQAIADRMNNTPRKCLGYKTPAELFLNHLLHFKRESTYRLSPVCSTRVAAQIEMLPKKLDQKRNLVNFS